MGAQIAQTAQPIAQQQSSGKGGPVSQVINHVNSQQPVQNVGAPEDMNMPMGGPNGQAQQPLGKGSQGQNSMFAQGGRVTYPGQGGQPQMGRPNAYSNTVGPWDNASIQPQTQSGKGKGY